VVLSGATIYGTTAGFGNDGTIFTLWLGPPQLAITVSANNILLHWPAVYSGYVVQSTTNLSIPDAWTTDPAASTVTNGQNIIFESLNPSATFFRLSSQ
jgi:hypothetical protein